MSPFSSVMRDLEGNIRFCFADARGNVMSVPWTQEQLDSYINSLAQYKSPACG